MTRIIWDPPKASDSDIEQLLGNHPGLFGIDRSRMGRLLCDQLVHGITTRTLNSFAVTDVLEALEVPGRTPPRCRVEPRPFRWPPLRGLMHAHFSQASFVARNIQNELQRSPSFFEDALGIRGAPDGAELNRIAHEATIGMYEHRAARKATTGEWLIYAEHQGSRFYLAIAAHDEGDHTILSRIEQRSESHLLDILRAATH